MADILGKKWVRACSVHISNPLGGVPSIVFSQEVVASFDDGTTLTLESSANIVDDFKDPTESFNLLNPADDSIIGTATYQDIYVMLYGLHRHVASK